MAKSSSAPIVRIHDGVRVVRDDLFPGGTKARYVGTLFRECDELVYASPQEGGAQTAIAWVAKDLGKRATIFVAKRAVPHARPLMAKALGATIYQVSPGHLTVVQARARAYCAATGARLAPFGMDLPEAIEAIAQAARQISPAPTEVWCAAGSGVLARGLALAWPKADRHVVQVGRALCAADVAGATIHIAPLKFGEAAAPSVITAFPADPHYDAKAWTICREKRGDGDVLFWNVTGPAEGR
jgi:hypothetical protein